jgi:S1-C subfamily serine protease
VIDVDREGRAADLGIETGHVIIEVNGKAVHTPDDISNALNEARTGGRQATLMRIKSANTAVAMITLPSAAGGLCKTSRGFTVGNGCSAMTPCTS